MIFKTFDNDIDKISSKWGIFGKSFNEIGNAITGKISDINKGFQATDDLIGSIKNSDSILKRLYPDKKTIQGQIIDVDSLLPEIDESQANKILDVIKSIENGTNEEIKSFQELYDTGDKQNQWIAQYGQSTKGQIRTTEDLIKANQAARESAIAHNKALQQQTLSAKAGSVALKALSIAGNMLVMWGISELISVPFKIAQAFDDMTERAREAADAFNEQSDENQ